MSERHSHKRKWLNCTEPKKYHRERHSRFLVVVVAPLLVRESIIITPVERATSTAEVSLRVEVTMHEINHLQKEVANYSFGNSLQEARRKVIKNERRRVDISTVTNQTSRKQLRNVSTWEVVQRREVLPCKAVPYFTFVIYIELGERESIGQNKVKRCMECEYVDLSVLVILI